MFATADSPSSGLAAAIFWIIVLSIYMFPTYISWSRKTQYTAGICVLNATFGWTVLGWIGALIWAVSARGHKPTPPAHVDSTSGPDAGRDAPPPPA